jgi:predicted AAA+ superfamily ATPase
MNFYSRTIYKHLLDHLEKKQITVLTGMRGTGKTTLVKQLMHQSTGYNKMKVVISSN